MIVDNFADYQTMQHDTNKPEYMVEITYTVGMDMQLVSLFCDNVDEATIAFDDALENLRNGKKHGTVTMFEVMPELCWSGWNCYATYELECETF